MTQTEFQVYTSITTHAEYEQLKNKLESTTDKLGMKIDEGIFNTVLALNALGIPTSGSCEGHLEHGEPYPWVDVSMRLDRTKETNDLIEKSKELKNKGESLIEEGASINIIRDIFKEARELDLKIFHPIRIMYARVLDLLIEFYTQHKTEYKYQIIIDEGVSRGRIQSIGIMLQKVPGKVDRKIELEKYKNEMNVFSEFLLRKVATKLENSSR